MIRNPEEHISKWKFLYLLLIPLLLLVIIQFLSHARGPYWLGGNLDPSYPYLLNSLNIYELQAPLHVDHPGTPLQVLGAAIIAVVGFIRQAISIESDVLRHPELYLYYINLFLVFMNIIASLVLGIFAFFVTRSILLSMIAQSIPLSSSVNVLALTNVSPEPLLVFTVTLFVLAIILTLQYDLKEQSKKFILLFSVLAGLGMATKITFFPLVLVPLLLLPTLNDKVKYIGASVGTFIVLTLPMAQSYLRLVGWIGKLSVNAGEYGSGKPTIIDKSTYIENMKMMVAANREFFLLLCLVILLIIFFLAKPKHRDLAKNNPIFKIIMLLSGASVIQILIVAKYGHSHYLLPALMLSGALLFFVVIFLRDLESPDMATRNLRYLFITFYVGMLLFGLAGTVEAFDTYLKKKSVSLALNDRAEKDFGDYTKVYYYRASSVEYALKFGSDWSGPRPKLNRIYPSVYFYNIWGQEFYDWTDAISPETLMRNERVLFQGTSFTDIPEHRPPNNLNLQLVDLQKGRPETLYRARTNHAIIGPASN